MDLLNFSLGKMTCNREQCTIVNRPGMLLLINRIVVGSTNCVVCLPLLIKREMVAKCIKALTKCNYP